MAKPETSAGTIIPEIHLARPLTDRIMRLIVGTGAIGAGIVFGVMILAASLQSQDSASVWGGVVFTLALGGLAVGMGWWILRPALLGNPFLRLESDELQIHAPLLLRRPLSIQRSRIRSVALRDPANDWHASGDLEEIPAYGPFVGGDDWESDVEEPSDAGAPFITYARELAPNLVVVLDPAVGKEELGLRRNVERSPEYAPFARSHALLFTTSDAESAGRGLQDWGESMQRADLPELAEIPTPREARRGYHLAVLAGVAFLVLLVTVLQFVKSA